jgi:hypothetical protein
MTEVKQDDGVRFIHLRKRDADGTPLGHGGTTIAYTTHVLSEDLTQVFYYAAHITTRSAVWWLRAASSRRSTLPKPLPSSPMAQASN